MSSASRSSSIEFVQSDTALVPRGGGTGGSRSLQLGGSAVLEASRGRARPGPKELAAELLEAAPDDIVAHRRRHASASPASRPARSRGPSSRRKASERATRSRSSTTSSRRARRSRSARTSRSSRSTPRPAGSSRSATSRSTTAVASSTRCSSTARSTAGSRRASRRRCGRSSSTTPTATRSRRRSPTTRSRARPSCRSFEAAHTETPSPLNPLGAKGIGESATIGSHARGAERGRRRAQPPRRAPHRHAVHARAGVARDRATPRRARCPTRGASRPAAFATLPVARARRPQAHRGRRHRPLKRPPSRNMRQSCGITPQL